MYVSKHKEKEKEIPWSTIHYRPQFWGILIIIIIIIIIIIHYKTETINSCYKTHLLYGSPTDKLI